MRKRVILNGGILSVGFFLLWGFFSYSVRAEEAPAAAEEAAREGLPRFLNTIPAGSESDFGFSSSDRLERAGIGDPFPLSTIMPADLKDYRDGDPVDSLLTETGTWYFPVILDGEYRAILTVARMAGQWKAVGFGRALLARKLQRLRSQWPSSKGYQPRLAVSPQARQYLFTIPRRGGINLTPLTTEISAGRKRAGDYSILDNLSETVERILPSVIENLKGGGRASPGTGSPDEID